MTDELEKLVADLNELEAAGEGPPRAVFTPTKPPQKHLTKEEAARVMAILKELSDIMGLDDTPRPPRGPIPFELPHEATEEEIAMLRQVAPLAVRCDRSVAEMLGWMIGAFREMMSDKV